FDPGVESGRAGIGRNALLNVLRFADIQHVAATVEHAIDARPRRRDFGVLEYCGAAGGQRTFVLVKAKLGRLLFWHRRRLLFVLFDDLRFRSEIWFGNAAHARACRPIARESHMASGKAQPSSASIQAAPPPLSNIQSLNDSAVDSVSI